MTVDYAYSKKEVQTLVESIYTQLEDRLAVSSLISCPVEFTSAVIGLTATQSCGKCTPCRVGLAQLDKLVTKVLDGNATPKTLTLIENLAEDIFNSADCAIGYEAAAMALRACRGFKDSFLHHIQYNSCGIGDIPAVPCVAGCPANVDVPAYLALVAEGRHSDAIRVIRKDNPLAIACSMICEHPCEVYCRRGMVDDPINIRGLKRFAADNQSYDYRPAKAAPTGKRIAVVGSGPSGLTVAYYLALMGHQPTIFEQRQQLGGMLRYGIPEYRLPRDLLDQEISWLLDQGIQHKTNTSVGSDITFDELTTNYDAVYLAIGAHGGKPLNIEGADAKGVHSAILLLRDIADGQAEDFTHKTVCVIGSGNVAMDVARTVIRLGADNVKIVYRRRRQDMPAHDAEVDAAIADGCEFIELSVPVRIEQENNKVKALVVQQQIIGKIVKGRATSTPANVDETKIDCDIVVFAFGQEPEAAKFAEAGVPTQRGLFYANVDTSISSMQGVFCGGECVSGPSTVINAVADGKKAARSIDSYLGFDHQIELDVEIPPAKFKGRQYCARSNTTEYNHGHLVGNFSQVENGLIPQEASQEASRCLRCDHFGYGSFRGGRSKSW
ncbi:glutamate synthase [Actinomycetota bacterium]|nr:glutamate synthase [Actinomycetota bacterium]